MSYRVAYQENPARSFIVTLVFSWKRGEIQPAMSASSGPKDYIRNQICTVFDRLPTISRVLMVRGEYAQSVPFLLLIDDTASQVFDITGKAVVVKQQPAGGVMA